MGDTQPITVTITRRVRSGSEQQFEAALHEFIAETINEPGQLGVHVVRPAPGDASREYGIVRKYSSRRALEAFQATPVYREWQEKVGQWTEGEMRVDELCGLESWFTPSTARLRPLSKPRMAFMTFLGVYPTSILLNMTVGPLLKGRHILLQSLVFSALMVSVLTWLVMPILSHWLHRLLQPKGDK